MEPNFEGWATKANLKCSDGRTIMSNAFQHQDKMRVPLVWQHGHDDISNMLGHVDLENRPEGVWAKAYFNQTPSGENGRLVVEHGDITQLSIFAGGLHEQNKQVFRGNIKEVSLVMAGANPGARIQAVRLQHGDDPDEAELIDDAGIITTEEHFVVHSADGSPKIETPAAKPEDKVEEEPEEKPDENLEHAKDDEISLQDVLDSMTEVQRNVVIYLIDKAASTVAHSDLPDDATPQQRYDALSPEDKTLVHGMIQDEVAAAKKTVEQQLAHNNQEGSDMTLTHNVFDGQNLGSGRNVAKQKLDPERVKKIFRDAKNIGSLKDALLQHANNDENFLAHADPVAGEDYGVADLDVLFPDARLDGNGISIVSRRMEWVNDVLTSTKHSPFTRVKSIAADLTADEARAKGYVKGTRKRDEVIRLLKRTTGPKTIYKKQKLDRDDILDITELDFVAWLKGEMRVMLDEEIARAVLVGDNRPADDPDKIDEESVRPIAYDDDMYTTRVELPTTFDYNVPAEADQLVDFVVLSMENYKGSGSPALYTTLRIKNRMLLARNSNGDRIYRTEGELTAALTVSRIVCVEAMEQDTDLVGVIVNLTDYTIGADRGGQVSMFDDFDIDYNQEKYLLETRISGALTRPKSAIAIFKRSDRTVTPQTPGFNAATGVVTIPAQSGVVYRNADTNVALASGAQAAIAPGAVLNVDASPAAGFAFTHNADAEWPFQRNA